MTNSESMIVPDEKVKEPAEAKKKESARKVTTEEKEAEIEERKKKEAEAEEKKKKREEERKKKEEEKKKKDEDRRVKDEEKKKREEEQQRKERSQLRLTSLFKTTADERPLATVEAPAMDFQGHQIFPPFHVKEHVQMAEPGAFKCSLSTDFGDIISGHRNETKSSTEALLNEFTGSFGSDLRRRRGVEHNIDLRSLLGHDPTMPLATAASFDGRDLRSMLKMKFLQFREDIRPAYWGTWTKTSKKILPRRPFAMDTDHLDYDHDSEAEWEPEGEGEDIKSGDEEDEDVDVADPDDAGWLVPEGYLSNDEGIGSDKEEEGVRTNTSSKKRGPVKQICIGVMFDDSSDDDDTLSAYAMHQLAATFPIDPFAPIPSKHTSDTADNNSASAATDKRPTAFPVEHTPQLIDAIKGKAEGMPKLIAEVKAMQGFEDVSKRQIEATIKNIAVKEKRGSDARPIWYIKE
ncbi:chromatin assembly factor 1 subunit A-domain-containing protein [Umbelopsis sp. AD052]|nr:chromatin assembly factor 1 subunit A-domain-containing protein [Umbelopsis sp. AD052]